MIIVQVTSNDKKLMTALGYQLIGWRFCRRSATVGVWGQALVRYSGE